MDSTHCIILCAGNNSRWKGQNDIQRKHLIEIEGEVLLKRTIKLSGQYMPTRTFVVVNSKDIALYKSHLTTSTELFGIDPNAPNQTEAYKYLSSRDLWNPEGRTIVLLGDVWFSEKAMMKIFDRSIDDWTAFGRAGASKLTGHPYGELFAQRFRSYAEHEEKLMALDAMYLSGACSRPASGWAHYQLMIGANPDLHTVGKRFVEINDFTDDFDFPEDLVAWNQGRSLYGDVPPRFPKLRKLFAMLGKWNRT